MKKNSIFLGLKDKICDFYKKNKRIFFSVVACFCVIIILCISVIADFSKDSKEKSANTESLSVTKYARELEEKLKTLILGLDSVKKVSIFVMVESTPTVTYLTETSERVETKEGNSVSEKTTTVVFEKNGSISTPVVITTIMPKVTGVLILTNKINASTRISIKNSISVVLNIDESCISILQES